MNCAQATEAEVDDEVKKLIASCYEEAKQIIRENREVMDQLARYLYDHETITGKEFMKYQPVQVFPYTMLFRSKTGRCV